MNKFQDRYGSFNELPQNMLGYKMAQLWKTRLITLPQRELEYLYGLEELVSTIAGHKVKIYVADYYSHMSDKVLGNISGFSMGMYICLNSAHDLETLKHEIGHQWQSQKFGWFYLPIVGIYSAVFCNCWDRWFHTKWEYYDRHYWYYKKKITERSADKRGKVDRNKVLARIERKPGIKYRYPDIKAA